MPTLGGGVPFAPVRDLSSQFAKQERHSLACVLKCREKEETRSVKSES